MGLALSKCWQAVWAGLAVVLFLPPAAAQLRVATWNVTNYSGGRWDEFQTAVYAEYQGRSMTPDIIIGQEFLSSYGAMQFRNLLNAAPGSPGDWAMAPFVDGADTDNAFFYRARKLELLGYTVVSTGGPSPNHPRNVMRYDVRLEDYTSDAAVLACYSSHMKAGITSEDQARRLLEAQRIRSDADTLNPQWQFLLGADLNIRSSGEPAYQELVESQPNNDGRLFDPISRPGNWNNNHSYRVLHTQDPVGLGGMDDRYDQVLLSAGLVDGEGFDYLGDPGIPASLSNWNDPNHSYRAWGNDGTSYNTTLTIAGNQMVGAAIAQALVDAALTSGHLPVFIDLRVPPQVGSDELIDFGQVPEGSAAVEVVLVWNAGDVGLWSEAGIADLEYTLAASPGFSAPTGSFSDAAGGGINAHLIQMDTSTVGPVSGTLTIASNAPDEPQRLVTLIGEVVPAGLLGDLDCSGVLDAFDIDPFVLALTDPEGYAQAFPECDRTLADINGDGAIDSFDIDPFVELLTGE